MAAVPTTESNPMRDPVAAVGTPVAPVLRRQSSIRKAGSAAAGHLQKHKIKHSVGCGVIITVAVVLGVVLGATAAVYHYTQRQATPSEQARSARAESAAVNFGQISVVPPKEETDASRRLAGAVHAAVVSQLSAALTSPVARRKLRSVDTSSFDILSDFRTATTSTSVDDGLGGALITPNMILCMLEQTRAEKFFNKGPYIANVDERVCQAQAGGGPSSDDGPKITEWTVLATGPSATETKGMYEVSAWLSVNGFDISFKTETPKEKITFFPDDDLMRDPVVDEFTIKFQTPKNSANQAVGFIMVAKEGEDKTLKYIMQQSMHQISMLQSVIVSYNKDTEAGWAKTRMPNSDFRNQEMVDASVSWSANFLKQSSQMCLDRKNFVGVGQGYKLFDSEGAHVDIESHITVQTTLVQDDSKTLASTGKVIKAGTQFVAGIGGNHIYMHSVYDDGNGDNNKRKRVYTEDEENLIEAHYFGAGKKVSKHSYSDTANAGAEFTIHRLPGEMTVSKEVVLPLSRFEGAMLNTWVHERCGTNSTAGAAYMGSGRIRLEVKNGKMYKTGQTTTSFERCNCEDGQCPASTGEYTPTRWMEYPSDVEVTEQQIHFYSDLIRGSAVYQPSIPDTIKVGFNVMLHPKKAGKEMRLICMSRCIDGSKDPIQYFPSPSVNSRDNAREYTFNEQTGVLLDPNGFPVTDSSNDGRGYSGPDDDMSMMLLEPTEATFQALGCAGSDTSIACLRSEWGVFPRYRWSPVSLSSYLTDSAGNLRIPADALNLKVEIPDGVNPRSLSGLSYAGKSLQIRYENGYIAGLPSVCQNKQTFEYRVADFDIWGDVMHARCDYKNAEEKVSDLLLPAGIMAVHEDLMTGTKTRYVLKPTRVLQKLKSSKNGMASCADATPPPEDATFPTLDAFDDESFLNMAARPAADALLVKVEAGELVAAAEEKDE